jgi:single-stranded-DNA-specific exonuclease
MDGLGLAEPVAVTLVRRGYRTVEDARAFLECADDHDPFAFAAMREVCERITAAIAAGRRITVHGDYDVDGVSATAILVRTLRELGADCDWLIPGRLTEGYGLTTESVEPLRARGTSMLITVDCAITAVDAVAAAQAAGIEVIVTDHHEPGAELPECPILHPVVSGYPFEQLCAAGVAYKLAVALRGREAADAELDLVALATVADLVVLHGENRSLVRRGLAVARRARRPGLRALMTIAQVAPETLDEGHFAFRLGPRINAAGRLYRADAGVELMLTSEDARAEEIATELDRANLERREVERETLAGAEQARAQLPPELAEAPGLVLAGQGWHPGVVGIVASRMVERHGKPVVLIGLDGERGRGSGRSVPGFDLLGALDCCAEHLSRYGGHRAAAGLEIEAACVDDFQHAFAKHCADTRGDAPPAVTEIVDAVVGGESLGHDVAEQLARLGPFGNGNPSVRLLVAGAQVGELRPMGEGDKHARFVIRSGPARASGVAFGVNGSLAAAVGNPHDVSVSLELNEWNGAVEPRVVLGRMYPLDDGSAEPCDELSPDEFWRRFDEEDRAELEPWPPQTPATSTEREEVVRRTPSVVATLAALASSGETVLALCADSLRRRELVERAARPARFGGGELALISPRLPDAEVAAAEARVLVGGCGVVLADWASLARNPQLAGRFAHVVVIDPPPFEHLNRLSAAGEGYIHRVHGDGERKFALRVHADEWPSRSALADLYRGLGAAGLDLAADRARAILCGEGRTHGRSAEASARMARVLRELDLVNWEDTGPNRRLSVVSSTGTDLERSRAFVAYRERYEEGRRYLTGRRQT